jgi:predicted TIM-barrel fold metal-dependent hydrolase
LPAFAPDAPLYDPRFEPIWDVLDELELVANSHIAISSTSTAPISIGEVPHPACVGPLTSAESFHRCRQILSHLIWGGVLERHPNLKVVFTEEGSDWVISMLRGMDHTYQASFVRPDIREAIPRRPSEYFQRQCYLGSSVFSRAEVEARDMIGRGKMMIGVDYPHHEGTWTGGTQKYLQATLGAARVPVDEARALLAETAISVFGFDESALRSVADRVGPLESEILTVPTEDWFGAPSGSDTEMLMQR